MKIFKFKDFLLENTSNQLSFRLSERLRLLLSKINHPISKELLRLDDQRNLNKYTIIDYDDNNVSNFKYVLSDKIYDIVKKRAVVNGYDDDTYTVNNFLKSCSISKLITNIKDEFFIITSIGKVINKLFPNVYKPSGKPGEDIESFTNLIKSKRDNKFEKFKIVSGDDIIKYYNVDSYSSESNGSSLGNSCMRHEKCSDYINFYAINEGVKLVILFSDDEDDKILGRALLWDIDEINDVKVENVKFMDRIYTVYDSDVLVYKEYATKNGWLYKNKQDMSSNTPIVNPKTGNVDFLKLKTTDNFKKTPSDKYPYMDTMKWFFIDNGFLSNTDKYDNNTSKYYFMESTSGDYQIGVYNGIYVEYYDRFFNEDDLIWCDYGEEYRLPEDAISISRDSYATLDYIDDNMVWSDIERKYLEVKNSTYLPRYDTFVSQKYINEYMVYSDYLKEYLLDEESIFSKYYDTYLDIDDSVKVYTDINENDVDFRIDGDGTYIEIINSDKYFDAMDDDLMENFIEVINEIDPHKIIWDFKSNKNKYIKVKGNYYNKKFEDELTGQLRLEL